MRVSVFFLLIEVLAFGHQATLSGVCTDKPVCALLFGSSLDKIDAEKVRDCNVYTTRQTCCVTCNNLIGVLRKTGTDVNPNCKWGDAGPLGIMIAGNRRMTCAKLTREVCKYLCQPGEPFYSNCCQTCIDVCE